MTVLFWLGILVGAFLGIIALTCALLLLEAWANHRHEQPLADPARLLSWPEEVPR